MSKFNTDEIYADYPQHTQEYIDFIHTDIPDTYEEQKAWSTKWNRLSNEHDADIQAWKAKHKEYFDWCEMLKQKCLSCANFIEGCFSASKCRTGNTIRDNGYCKGYKPLTQK